MVVVRAFSMACKKRIEPRLSASKLTHDAASDEESRERRRSGDFGDLLKRRRRNKQEGERES